MTILEGDNVERFIRCDPLAAVGITSELHQKMELGIRLLHQATIVPRAVAPACGQLANLARQSVISRCIPNPHFACEPDMRVVKCFCKSRIVACVDRRQEIVKGGTAFCEKWLWI